MVLMLMPVLGSVGGFRPWCMFQVGVGMGLVRRSLSCLRGTGVESGLFVNRRVGRRPCPPKGDFSTVTLRLSRAEKLTLMRKADEYGMSMTQYVVTLVIKDGT
jgi:hypothetical protein